MKTTDLFKSNRSAKRLNESLEKTFGTKINFEDFDTAKLEDARNKLRTQIHDARSQSGFNETIENETLTKAQWMHDAIVSELAEREEYIVDTTTDENYESMWADADIEEGSGIDRKELMDILKRFDENMNEIGGYGDPDFDKILAALNQGDVESAVEEVYGNYSDQDGGELRDMDAYIEDLEYEFKDLAGVSDDDEGGETDDGYALASAGFGSDEDYESVNNEGGQDWMDDMRAAAHKMAPQDKLKRDYETRQSQQQAEQQKKLQQDIENLPELMAQFREMKSEYESLGGSNWQYADREQNLSAGERKARDMESSLRQLANRISAAKQGDKENMSTESVKTGEDMARLQEGEIQQASAIVTAKTMVDRVGRWIEELSGMENDTLLQLGDSIRDEMGQEQAKAFIEAVAPAIQQALETLKGTRDTLSTGVRSLASGEQPTDMLGAEPDAMGGDEMAAEPDAMNMGDDMGGEDEFAAAEPAAGGLGDAGREQRESISRSSSLLRVLAG